MTTFEFGTTPPPRGPFDDWERAFSEPAAEADPERSEPPRCDKDCCVPQPREGGGLL
jgi:hypothetical protein